MNRSEKIDLLRRIQSGEASTLDMEPIVLIFFDHILPESDRKYYILRGNKPVEVSGEAVDKITTQKLFFDLEDMYL